MVDMAKLLTVGDVARALEEPQPRVNYALAKACIQPVGRVGILRMFSVDQLPEIREAIDSIRVRVVVG